MRNKSMRFVALFGIACLIVMILVVLIYQALHPIALILAVATAICLSIID